MPDPSKLAKEGPRLPWSKGIAPRYIALFLLVPFADQLAGGSLALGGLGAAIVGATVGAALAMFLLYYPSAILGLRSRLPTDRVAASTFGQAGAAWLVPAVVAVAQLVWFAVTIDYAVEVVFQALHSLGLLHPSHLRVPGADGAFGADGLFLWVSACWTLASVLIGTIAFRLVAAVMAGYQAFPALVLGALAIWAIPQVANYQPPGPGPGSDFEPWVAGFMGALQYVFGFSATFAVLGADWGAASRFEDDVRYGGLVGLVVAPTVIATLVLLIVAGANGSASSPRQDLPGPGLGAPIPQLPTSGPIGGLPPSPESDVHLTLRDSIASGSSPRLAGIALIILDLGLLGPACFAPFVMTREARKLAPKLPRWACVLAGAALAWPLVALRIGMHLGPVLTFLGALMAPLGGAIAAECVRQRGIWPGPRPGTCRTALAAWSVGFLVGIAPILGGWTGLKTLDLPLPTLLAWFAAFAIHWFGSISRPRLDASTPAPTNSEPSPSIAVVPSVILPPTHPAVERSSDPDPAIPAVNS